MQCEFEIWWRCNGTNPEHKMKEIKRNKSVSHEVKKTIKHDNTKTFIGFQADWLVSRISIGTAESEHGWSLPRDLLCSQSSSLYPLWRSFSVQLLRVVPSSLASCSDSAKLHRSLRVPWLVVGLVGLRCFGTARQGRKIKIGHTGQTARRCRCDAKFSLASNVVACFSFPQSLLARRLGVQQQLRHLDRAVAALNQLKPVAQPWQLSKCSKIGGEATDLLHRVAYFLLDQVLQVFILLIGHVVTIRRSRRMICHLQSITSMIIWYSILTLIFVCPLTVSLLCLMILDCKWVVRLRCSSKCRVDFRILDKWIQRESGFVGEVTLRSCCGHRWNVAKQPKTHAHTASLLHTLLKISWPRRSKMSM